jgi:hypothetical protein
LFLRVLPRSSAYRITLLRVTESGWDSGSCSDGDQWAGLVQQLSRMPDAIERLAAEHMPDAALRCVACTTPGRGTAHVRWPCGLRRLADAALETRVRLRD